MCEEPLRSAARRELKAAAQQSRARTRRPSRRTTAPRSISARRLRLVLIDASLTLHTSHGDLTFAHEQIVYNTSPSGDGEFSILAEVTGGAGRYAGATGYIQGVGTRPLSTGVATGSYVGEIALG